jgi:predicted RNA-binding protein (virulence factor B family)
MARLRVRRFAAPGAFLAEDGGTDELLLPNAEVPEGLGEGDELEVFVHLDSDDRPIATLRTPGIKLGEVAFLEVKDVTSFGAFVDWGLVKQLLVPLAEQTRDVRVGERHAIGLVVDRTGRLAGTMRISEMLRGKPPFSQDQWVSGEAWRNDPDIGLFVILERAFVGLVPKSEPHHLSRGEAARFRVTNVLPDGKVELSLRGLAHEERDADAAKILDVLARTPPPKVGDHSSPEEIRARFGLSKKAFKRAAGGLLRRGLIAVGADGCFVARDRSR